MTKQLYSILSLQIETINYKLLYISFTIAIYTLPNDLLLIAVKCIIENINNITIIFILGSLHSIRSLYAEESGIWSSLAIDQDTQKVNKFPQNSAIFCYFL